MAGALRSFDSWMNGSGPPTLILALFANVLLLPFFALVHELGHAAVGLLRSEGLVVVRVGRRPARWSSRVGRLQFELNPRYGGREPPGQVRTFAGRDGRAGRVLYLMAGPGTHALAAGALWWVGAELRSQLIALTGIVALVYAVANLIPFTRHGFRSDGARLVDALTGVEPSGAGLFTGPLGDNFTRWLALWSDQSLRSASRVRGVALATCASALGYRDDEQGVAVWELGFAGWCWREAERGGDFSRIRDAVLDALHAATVTGAPEPQLTALAARNLLAGPVDVGLASPGTDDVERSAVLAAAFARLPLEVRRSGLSLEHQRFAFRYGVALRDVERIRA